LCIMQLYRQGVIGVQRIADVDSQDLILDGLHSSEQRISGMGGTVWLGLQRYASDFRDSGRGRAPAVVATETFT